MAFSFCCAPLHAVRIVRNSHKAPYAPDNTAEKPLSPGSFLAANLAMNLRRHQH
jgi:hypothetical protein